MSQDPDARESLERARDVAQEQPCLYLTAQKKRGLPEGYVRGMEKLWAVMVQKIPGLDDAVRKVVSVNEEELSRIWNHHKHGEDLRTIWKESSVLSELERLLSRLEQPTAPDHKRKRDREPDQGVVNPLSEDATDLDATVCTPEFRITEITDNLIHTDFYIAGSTPTPGGQLPSLVLPSRSQANLLDFPYAASSLLNHYFTFTHCWFPILDRPHTLKKFYEHTRSRKRICSESPDLAYLWAIFAYVTQQRISQPTPDLGGAPTIDDMRAMARHYIPADDGPFSLGHVQALLLLVLLDIGLGKWTSAWMLVGLASRALLEIIDLDQDLRTREIAATNPAKSWTGTLQGCFILETLISMRLRRPQHLQRQLLGRVQLLEEDGLEEWEPWNAIGAEMVDHREPAFIRSCFNRMTEVFMVANDSARGDYDQTQTSRVQDSLRDLQRLADTYPFKVLELGTRPPHQLLLQASHFVIATGCSFPDMSAAHGSMFLQTLESFEHSWSHDKIPSMFAGLIHVLNYEAVPISQRQQHIIARLSVTWPGFQQYQISTWSGPQLPISSTFRGQPSISPLRNDTSDFDVSLLSTFSKTNTLPVADPMFTFPQVARPSTAANVEGGSVPGYHHVYGGQSSQQLPGVSFEYPATNIDQPPQQALPGLDVHSGKQSTGYVRPSTSPTFDGDEIDALFHEMAQLDTNEWCIGRVQGLKDFGFMDGSTFEAFCNDPNRLLLEEGLSDPAPHLNQMSYETQASSSMERNPAVTGHLSQPDNFGFDHII
ncbi:hypothetical protein LTS15_001405 [Exophiala xenobiotica]|nr:hypothetical protein LTS15_001405 [Exophiala xenobiotica]